MESGKKRKSKFFYCKICGQKLVGKVGLNNHMREHESKSKEKQKQLK